jgi:hypothetical protein
MIPKLVIVLMLTSTTTLEHFWYPSQVFESVAECRDAAPPKGETDPHGFPVEWTCVEFRRGSAPMPQPRPSGR